MCLKEMLVQLLESVNEFELKDLAGTDEEEDASKTLFVRQKIVTSNL